MRQEFWLSFHQTTAIGQQAILRSLHAILMQDKSTNPVVRLAHHYIVHLEGHQKEGPKKRAPKQGLQLSFIQFTSTLSRTQALPALVVDERVVVEQCIAESQVWIV